MLSISKMYQLFKERGAKNQLVNEKTLPWTTTGCPWWTLWSFLWGQNNYRRIHVHNVAYRPVCCIRDIMESSISPSYSPFFFQLILSSRAFPRPWSRSRSGRNSGMKGISLITFAGLGLTVSVASLVLFTRAWTNSGSSTGWRWNPPQP
jgi:hypothetical protein